MLVRSTILAFFSFCLFSCGPKVIFEDTIDIPTPWPKDQGVGFDFVVEDTTNAYNIVLDVKYEDAFKYQNLYAKFVTKFPDGSVSNDVTSLDIRDLSGKSQGNCSGDYCTVPFLIQANTYFRAMGSHNIQLYQHSRQDTLSGIVSIGMRIEAVE